jgi:uncharacterized phage protein (TIGR01671 family)
MREIKFRAWRGGDGGCMEFGHYVADHGNINWFNLSKSVGKDLILMQFTGLKDKNGKEIYEGDIVKWDDSGAEGFEKMEVDVFRVRWECGEDELGWNLYPFQDFEYEVIGNIYENPELLKP